MVEGALPGFGFVNGKWELCALGHGTLIFK